MQVGIEKEKVNAENEAAKVEADKCAAIAREVMEKQASCERDLSAAEPLLLQAEAALDTLNKKVGSRQRRAYKPQVYEKPNLHVNKGCATPVQKMHGLCGSCSRC